MLSLFERLSFCLLLCCALSCKNAAEKKFDTWNVYSGSNENIKYSSLTQIDTTNVNALQVAWEYHTGDADTAKHSQMQCNPLIIDGIMYFTSPQLKLIAVDAATGAQKWVFDPDKEKKDKNILHFILNNNRGISYWSNKDDRRIFFTAGSMLYAIDADDGKPIQSFGIDGRVDLHDGLGREVKDLYVAATSPGIVYKDLYITGSRVDEGAAAAPGHIRAYDVRTGKMRWIFILFRSPVKLVMIHGKTQKHGNISAAPTVGAV